MSDDEFDLPYSAPLPPADRDWRHPAEKAAVQREEFQRAASPPPLSRRSTIVVAVSSLLASVAVLAVAVPKGISKYTEDTVLVTTPSPPVKNFSGSTSATVSSRRGITSSLALGNGLFVVAADNIDLTHEILLTTPDGTTQKLSVGFVDNDIGVAVLTEGPLTSADLSVLDIFAQNAQDELNNLDSIEIQDDMGNQMLSAEIGFSTENSGQKAIPITTSRILSGIAVVRNGNKNIVGIALPHSHSSWLLPIELFRSVIQHCLQNMNSGK